MQFKKTPKIRSFILKLMSFLRIIIDIKDMIIGMVIDKIRNKGKDADIRLAYVGYWEKHSNITEQDWFVMHITNITNKKVSVSWYKPNLIISSVFGNHLVLKFLLKILNTPSLFFSGENISLDRYYPYRDYLKNLPSLALGCNDSPYAFRFPLWLNYIFTSKEIASASLEDVKNKLKEIESNSFLNKGRFAAMIARHDGFGISRTSIVQSLSTIDLVSCAGKFLCNDDTLVEEFNDNKKAYLRNFIFNICPENSSAPNYVTEKVFEAFEAGCIPVYWGDDTPEPDILNPKRIIFWQENSDNKANIQLIEGLYKDKKTREDFLKEPVFVEDADKVIYNYFLMLRKEVTNLFNKGR